MRTVWVNDQAKEKRDRVLWGGIVANRETLTVEVGDQRNVFARLFALNHPNEYWKTEVTLIPYDGEVTKRGYGAGPSGGPARTLYLREEVSYVEEYILEGSTTQEPKVEHRIVPKLPGSSRKIMCKWTPVSEDRRLRIEPVGGSFVIGRGQIGTTDTQAEVIAIMEPGQGLMAIYMSRTNPDDFWVSLLIYEGNYEFSRPPFTPDRTYGTFLMGIRTFGVVGDNIIEGGVPVNGILRTVQVGGVSQTDVVEMNSDLLGNGGSIPVMSKDMAVLREGRTYLPPEVGYLGIISPPNKQSTTPHRLVPPIMTGPKTDRVLVHYQPVIEPYRVEFGSVAGGNILATGFGQDNAPEVLALLHVGQGVRIRYVSETDKSFARAVTLIYDGDGEFRWIPHSFEAGARVGFYLV